MKHKGCVIEVRDETLVLMTASCDFVEIPKNAAGSAVPGMEVVYETRSRGLSVHKKWMAVAAMIMVLVMGSLFMMPPTSAMPVYVASIDINPSVYMLIDEAGHVVEVQPVNPEAEKLSMRNLRGKTIEEALSSLMDQLFEQGYFSDIKDHYMVFSLAAIDSSVAEGDVDNMMFRLENSIEELKMVREIQLEVLSYAAMEEELQEAESKDISLNHMLVRNQYQAMMTGKSAETADEQADESMETMVRTILKDREHPVFEEHPGADPGGNKDKKEDEPPKNKEDEEKEQPAEQQGEHPVFREHPGSPDKGRNESGQPPEGQEGSPDLVEHPGNIDKGSDHENKSDNQRNSH